MQERDIGNIAPQDHGNHSGVWKKMHYERNVQGTAPTARSAAPAGQTAAQITAIYRNIFSTRQF
jgi:hypothetical protein